MIKKPKKFIMKKSREESEATPVVSLAPKKAKKQQKEQGIVIKRQEGQKPKAESPKINRIIPESLFSFPQIKLNLPKRPKEVMVWIGGVLGVMLLLVVGFRLIMDLEQFQQIQQERGSLIRQKNTWLGIVQKYPGYRDAYFQLALVDYQLRNFQHAEQHVEKVLQLDPLFTPAQQLQAEIRIQGNKAL